MKPWWKDHPWRFIQTNLREIDMKDIDAKQYVRDMQSFHATIAMINTSGIIASYPTKLPYHYQSPYLTGDSLKDIIRECHDHGIRVMARTDFSKVRREIYEKHPDFAFVDTDGNIVDYNGDVHVCINSDYQQKYALEIIRETLEELPVDGIFFNMGGYVSGDYSGNHHGICQCENCKDRFHRETGLALPRREDPENPDYLAYLAFKRDTTQAYNRKVCEFIKSIRPDVLINHDTFTEDSGFVRQESNTAWDRKLPHWPYSGSENTKWVRGSHPNFISSNTTVDFIDFPVRHVAVSSHQQSLRLYQNLANAGMVDYYLMGRLDNHADRSGYEPIRKVFAFHKEHEELYHDLKADCKAVVLVGDHWGGQGSGDMAEFFGWYRALTEGHHFFDVMLLSEVTHVGLDDYDSIFMPNLEGVSDEAAAVIDAAVHRGATLISSGLTGQKDGDFMPRKQQALASLAGVNVKASRPARGAYFQTCGDFRGQYMPDTDLFAIDGDYLYSDLPQDAAKYGRFLPPQPFGPPERCYPLREATEYPAASKHSFGKGKVVWTPWYPGRLFHRQGYENTLAFLTSVIEGIAGMTPVTGTVPPTMEVTLLRREGHDFGLLHLVNGNGHFGNSFYPPTPVHAVTCRVPLARKSVQSVKSLTTKKTLRHDFEDGVLTVTVDEVKAFEALLIQ